MLDPSNRNLYSMMIKPPVGYCLDRAVATSFSLDPLMALTIPLHFAAFDIAEDFKEGIMLYEAIRRTADRIDIFIDKGRMIYPRVTHEMYSLLEPMLHECFAPNGGAFHPKCWLIRYVENDYPNNYWHRLIISSRNITFDNSWDMCLCLDENRTMKHENTKQNMPIKDLFGAVLANNKHITSKRKQKIEELLSGLDMVVWQYPDGIQEIDFMVFGLQDKPVFPNLQGTSRMIISPFCSNKALSSLVNNEFRETNILISRHETLDKLANKTLEMFGSVFTLADNNIIEETDEQANALNGLHAKVMVYNQGYYSTMYVGSANATDAAMQFGINVELMACLKGKKSKMGGTIEEGFLGLSEYLFPYQRRDDMLLEEDPKEELMQSIRSIIVKKHLQVFCHQADEDRWELSLVIDKPHDIIVQGDAKIFAWPITLGEQNQREIEDNAVNTLGYMSKIAVTGLIAFKIQVDNQHILRFVLNLPLVNAPTDREGALINHIISNKQNFLRYIYLLLCGQDDLSAYDILSQLRKSNNKWLSNGSMPQLPLLEEMVHSLAKDKANFYNIKVVVEKIASVENDIIPEDFKLLWAEIEKLVEIV